MLVLFSQSRLLGSNPVVSLCDTEPIRTFQKGPSPEKAKLRRWWTYLSRLRLSVHHIQGVKNECADYISRNNFDELIGARFEELAKDLARPNCTPFVSPKHLDFVNAKNNLFCHLENTVFQTLPKNAFFISFVHFLLLLGGSNNHSLVENQRA